MCLHVCMCRWRAVYAGTVEMDRLFREDPAHADLHAGMHNVALLLGMDYGALETHKSTSTTYSAADRIRTGWVERVLAVVANEKKTFSNYWPK